jgi:hypothetical protein
MGRLCSRIKGVTLRKTGQTDRDSAIPRLPIGGGASQFLCICRPWTASSLENQADCGLAREQKWSEGSEAGNCIWVLVQQVGAQGYAPSAKVQKMEGLHNSRTLWLFPFILSFRAMAFFGEAIGLLIDKSCKILDFLAYWPKNARKITKTSPE